MTATRDTINASSFGEANDILAAHASRLAAIEAFDNGGSIAPIPGYLLHPNETLGGAEFRQIPVVQMHNFADTNTALGVLKDYVAWGYTSIFFSELYAALAKGDMSGLPAKPIVLCDDDGGASSYTALYPELQALGLKCTYWLVPDWIDGFESNPPNGGTFLEANPITWAQAVEMQASGLVEFQSHTLSHGSLRLISGPRTFSGSEDGSGAGADFLAAKARIESQVPGANVRFNACPYGVINEAAIASLKAAGCLANRVSEPGLDTENDYDGSGPGGYVYPWTDPFRVPVTDNGNFKYIKQHNIFGVADTDGNMFQNPKFLVTQRGVTLPNGSWTFASAQTLPSFASPSTGPLLQGSGVGAATGAFHTDMIPVGLYGAFTIDWWVNCTSAPAASARLEIDCFLSPQDLVPVQTLIEPSPVGGTTGWTSKRWYNQADSTYAWIRPRWVIVGATSSSVIQVWWPRVRRVRSLIPNSFSGGVPIVKSRQELQTTAQGLVTQNYDRTVSASSSVMIGGTAYAMLVGVRPGDVITNVYVDNIVAGSGVTLFRAGIYSVDGVTLYASSADQHALFSTAATLTVPLSASWTVPAGVTAVNVVFVATASTTLPAPLRGANGSGVKQIGSNARPYATAGTALSDLPAAPLTLTNAGSPIAYWAGLG